jgi:ankyrin repeat protein
MVLHIASKYGQNRFIEWYFKYFDRNDAALKTNNGATCLHFACTSGSYMCVKNIVEAVPEIINIKTKNGLTPIYLGRHARYILVILIKLIEFVAVQGNHLDIVKLLVNEYKASFVERDLDGMSLLHVACQNGCLDVLKWLVCKQGNRINNLIYNIFFFIKYR